MRRKKTGVSDYNWNDLKKTRWKKQCWMYKQTWQCGKGRAPDCLVIFHIKITKKKSFVSFLSHLSGHNYIVSICDEKQVLEAETFKKSNQAMSYDIQTSIAYKHS